jgi:glycine betaine/proline transport system ATP-binding protein
MTDAKEGQPSGENRLKVHEDEFLEEFLPKIVLKDVVVEVVDSAGDIKDILQIKSCNLL